MKKNIYSFLPIFLLLFASLSSHSQTITSASAFDTSCGPTYYSIVVAGCTSGLTVKTWYGDGTTDSHPILCSGSSGYASFNHTYATAGTYTIKNVLYAGSVALDSVSNSHAHQPCRFVPIMAYNDLNLNCTYDPGVDFIMYSGSFQVDSAGVTIDTIPSCRWYKVHGVPGTVYSFSAIASTFALNAACPATGVLNVTIPPSTDSIPFQYLGFNCTSCPGPDLSMYPSFRAAITGARADILVKTNSTGIASTVTFDYSPKYTFGSIYPATTSYTVTGTSVTFDAGVVGYMQWFRVNLNPVAPLAVGDTINTKFTISPISGDLNPADNIVIRFDSLVGSYDPNRKSVTPSGYISGGTELEYLLEFENDGNDYAHNVHIMDTLSNYLDIKTLKTGISTHDVHLIQLNDGSNNILKFDFPNIMLPDTAHFPVEECRGMVTFSISAKSPLGAGTTIANRVGIYFDTNPVVMTNTVYSSVPYPSGLPETRLMKVDLYPNPVNNLLTIRTDGVAYKWATVYNIAGQTMGNYTIDKPEISIPTDNFAPGIYYVVLKGQTGSKAIKFLKQ